MPANPQAVHELAEQLRGCVCASLNATADQLGDTVPGCPCRACVVPGSAVADDCCGSCPDRAAGTLYVNVDRIYPVDPFPEPLRPQRWHECSPAGLDIAVDLTATLFRCTPTLDNRGNPPSCEQLEAAARIHHVDGWAMYRGTLCCLQALPARRSRGPRFVMQPLQPIRSDGGCQGWTQRVTVALDSGCTCPAEAAASASRRGAR